MSGAEQEQTGPLRIDSPDAPTVPDGRRPMDHRAQPKKKDKGPIPARQGNGYYADHATGDRLRSVTTILSGGVPKDGLIHWAAKMSAESAVENLPALVAASRFPDQLAEMLAWIRKAHTRKKDERADVGSAVHKIIEAKLLGLELPVSVIIGEDEVRFDGPELAPYVTNVMRFLEEWQPTFTASEMVVANPAHGYAGTLDFILASDGLVGDAIRAHGFEIPDDVDVMGDTKTGGEWDRLTSAGHVHGVYPEAGLQMSAYRQAKWCWLRDGSRVPMPATAEVGVVLHVRPEGYRLYPVLCGDRQYAYFRHAQMVDEWSSRLASAKADQPIIGPALELPKQRRSRAVA